MILAKLIAMLFCVLAAGGGLLLALHAASGPEDRSAWMVVAGLAAFVVGVIGMIVSGVVL